MRVAPGIWAEIYDVDNRIIQNGGEAKNVLYQKQSGRKHLKKG